jgi:hypothetical protein
LYITRRVAPILAALAIGGGVVSPALAQQPSEPPQDALQAGPVSVVPLLRLTSLGHDDNVFNRADDNNPEGDFTVNGSASADAWLNLTRFRVFGRGQADGYYFRQLTDLRAIDTDVSGRVEVPLSRFTPYVSGAFQSTRHRQNLEIDALDRRRTNTIEGGVESHVFSRATAAAFVHRSELHYDTDAIFLDTSLADVLNHREEGEGLSFEYNVTSLTTIGVEATRYRNRFDASPNRNSNVWRVTPMVAFNPLAVVSGRLAVGVERRRFLDGSFPDFTGTTVFSDLTYNLLDRTRFTVTARRQLEYSYVVGLADYLGTDVNLAVLQKLSHNWDVGGSVGRGRIAYRRDNSPENRIAQENFPDETLITWGLDAGYTLQKTRIGYYLDRRTRDTDVPNVFRGYDRLRTGLSVTYRF